MTQFDQTTERQAEELSIGPESASPSSAYRIGRNTARGSMELMARALVLIYQKTPINAGPGEAGEAIRMVKARGDWPLDEL